MSSRTRDAARRGSARRLERSPTRVSGGRRVPQPQPGLSCYAVCASTRPPRVPCFDQPDLKARWTLALDVPSGWQVLANGAETAREESSGVVKVGFAETPPLPSYLFAFAAGKFSIETGERAGRTFRMFHRETDAAKVARNRDAIFDLHAASLAWLERYTGSRIRSASSISCWCPSFQFGGMEHAGAIFYNASGLLLDRVGDAEPEARPRQRDRARDSRTCGSAIS